MDSTPSAFAHITSFANPSLERLIQLIQSEFPKRVPRVFGHEPLATFRTLPKWSLLTRLNGILLGISQLRIARQLGYEARHIFAISFVPFSKSFTELSFLEHNDEIERR